MHTDRRSRLCSFKEHARRLQKFPIPGADPDPRPSIACYADSAPGGETRLGDGALQNAAGKCQQDASNTLEIRRRIAAIVRRTVPIPPEATDELEGPNLHDPDMRGGIEWNIGDPDDADTGTPSDEAGYLPANPAKNTDRRLDR